MTAKEFSSFLDSISAEALSVMDAVIPRERYISIDLSICNYDLQSVASITTDILERYVNTCLALCNAVVGYGGYNETRNLYRRSAYFNKEDAATERNIHLGLDLWLGVGAPVLAPLDGILHSFAKNKNHGDYGPTIILRHDFEGVVFYTLYGHLSLTSIADLKLGQYFKQGTSLGNLGAAAVNGDYPPHLHFQIIRDLGDWKGDYPGVCCKKDLAFYLENCPDPNLLLKLGI